MLTYTTQSHQPLATEQRPRSGMVRTLSSDSSRERPGGDADGRDPESLKRRKQENQNCRLPVSDSVHLVPVNARFPKLTAVRRIATILK